MTTPDQPPIPQDRYEHAEAQLGGADSIEKTSYVVGKGTDPHARHETGASATAGSGGRSPLLWVGILLALAALVVYLSGIFG